MKLNEIIFVVVVSALLTLLVKHYNTQDIRNHNEQARFETVEAEFIGPVKPNEYGEIVR